MKKRDIKALVGRAVRDGEYAGIIEKVSLFGSYVRGEQTSESDIDLLVEFRPESSVTLFDLGGILAEFEAALGKKVDVAPADSLRPHLRDGILAEAELIYERVVRRRIRPRK